jgi:stearoyl-CoA desaturase (Delta-9 desaturase)
MQLLDFRLLCRQLGIMAVFGVPLAGAALGAHYIVDGQVGALDVVLFVLLYSYTMGSATLGFHRLGAHAAFQAAAPVQRLLLVGGCMAWQGHPIDWIAWHRRHHRYSDQPLSADKQEGDVHSPKNADGIVAGLLEAHMFWLLRDIPPEPSLYCPELLDDPDVQWVDRRFWLWAALSLIVPAGAGALAGLVAVGPSAVTPGAWHCFIIAGLLRIFCVNQFTYLVNSIGHSYGARDFYTGDEARNPHRGLLWPLGLAVSLCTFGEWNHNGHHRFQKSARFSHLPGQLDTGWLIICSLGHCGLTWGYQEHIPSGALVQRALSKAATRSASTAE